MVGHLEELLSVPRNRFCNPVCAEGECKSYFINLIDVLCLGIISIFIIPRCA